MTDLYAALTAALDAEQARTEAANTRLGKMLGGMFNNPSETIEHVTATANRALALIRMRREIAERHSAHHGFCVWCEYSWPCPDFLSVARATLPADHPALAGTP